ncbi:hypothetical protein L1049_016299 [Liquidambar formosana]|uniref:Uncharacterized protein n=1 Tax=Liquidambar formosana TaxID=63359 RepID=A0AAP0X2Y9_LIQFO
MGRAPCCEKMGLKKGPWTPQEDQILIAHIQKQGHGNWRALPKQAGLLRCGKSCRLRWANYLRPDIKRGNFSREEEETILKLHEILGNKWSAIAARLPGRTDNEIKNVWHTHLKKKLKQNQAAQDTKGHSLNSSFSTGPGFDSATGYALCRSPQDTSSEFSSVTDSSFATTITGEATTTTKNIKNEPIDDSSEYSFLEIDDSFWSLTQSSAEISSIQSAEISYMQSDMAQQQAMADEFELQFASSLEGIMEPAVYDCSSNIEDDNKDFWLNLFIGAGGCQNSLNDF